MRSVGREGHWARDESKDKEKYETHEKLWGAPTLGDPGIDGNGGTGLWTPPRVPKYTPRPTATAAPPITAILNQRWDHKLSCLVFLACSVTRVTLVIETVVSPTWLP